ncbi:hypothetical protein [Lutimaribacter saemankumensis]|uniref:Uncharacterized protein n=1 Tax=Lutimaribacter saemankumensis TaxID=490829 RepID=A0A1G8KBC9_9RHOB|nr:hypothetical protein [Lutimaribacter saemankumensis]SDI40659.1 hypothetical protein SAMN05421850_102477 [Lutimaribacter saemankumensis]
MILTEKTMIPLAFRDRPEWPEKVSPPSISYAIARYETKNGRAPQPILRGRVLGTPEIDLNDYACRAEIDWIELRLETQSHHQARNMQPTITKMLEEMGSSSTVFVQGPNREKRHIGDQFILKFQAPKPKELPTLMAAVCAKYAPQAALLGLPIAGIEVSVDFYVKSSRHFAPHETRLRRWQMVDILRRHLRPDSILTDTARGYPRFYGGKYGGGGSTYFVDTTQADLSAALVLQAAKLGLEQEALVPLDIKKHAQPEIDSTAYIGPRDFYVMLRTMNKITDRRNPATETAVELSPNERRARLEVTLQGASNEIGAHAEMGLATLGDLGQSRFKPIRRLCFEFFLPTFGGASLEEELGFRIRATERDVFAKSGVYGLDRFHRSVAAVQLAQYQRKTRKSKPSNLGKKGRLVSWSEMNEKIDRALKKLDRDWAKSGL